MVRSFTEMISRRRRPTVVPPPIPGGVERMATALRASERGLAATIDSVSDAVLTLDPNGRVLRMNAAAERITGWTIDCAHGRPLPDLIALHEQRDGSPGPALDGDALRLGLIVGAEDRISLARRDGARIPIVVNCTPTRGGAVLVLRDTTAAGRRHARQEVTERLAALDTLAAGIAHEINNPLATVDAHAAFLARHLEDMRARCPDEPLDELLAATAEIRDGAHRVAKVVSTLEALQRAPAADRVAVDVRDLLGAALDVAGNALRHRARVVCELPTEPLHVLAPPAALEQAFLNLLLNAADALPDGAASAHEVHVRCTLDPVGQVLVEIRDSGRGIAPEHLPRIFDAFFTTHVGRSSGLGLALVQGTVHAAGGHIDVSSTPGEGARFRVHLPRTHVEAPAEAPPATHADRRARRILAVDDERPVLRALSRLLRDGRQVDTVTSTAEALERLTDPSAEPYDLVLCDVMMPDLTGMDLHEALTERAPEYLERLVFMTGGAFTPRARAFLATVEAPCISKPFDLDELLAIVGEAAQPVQNSSASSAASSRA